METQQQTISARRRRTLADQCRASGYEVDRVQGWRASPRSPSGIAHDHTVEYRVWIAGRSLSYVSVGRVSMGTPCWARICRSGVTLAGPGYASGRWYPATLAGVERCRADYLLGHAHSMLADAIGRQGIYAGRTEKWAAATIGATMAVLAAGKKTT